MSGQTHTQTDTQSALYIEGDTDILFAISEAKLSALIDNTATESTDKNVKYYHTNNNYSNSLFQCTIGLCYIINNLRLYHSYSGSALVYRVSCMESKLLAFNMP